MVKKNNTKYRLFITKEENGNPSGEPVWEGRDVEDFELRKQHCIYLNYMGSKNCNGIKTNGSKLEKDVKVTSVSVQISKEKNEMGKRIWEDYPYVNSLHEPIRYM